MADLDRVLLLLDCTFVVSLFDLDALSPAQLAIASLRPDLDVLVRQRAYHEFLLRRDEYEQGFGADTPQPLFDLPLNFPIPPDLASLSPSQLLLLQYNPLCASAADAANAGARFLRLAENAKGAPSPPLPLPPPPPLALAELPLARCTATWDGGALSEAGALALRVEEAGLTVVRDSERLFTLEATEMDEVIVDLGADGTAATGWTLVLRLAQLSTSSHLTLASAAVRLELGATPSVDEGYKLLQSTVAGWSAKYTFEVKVVRCIRFPPPPIAVSHASLSCRPHPAAESTAPTPALPPHAAGPPTPAPSVAAPSASAPPVSPPLPAADFLPTRALPPRPGASPSRRAIDRSPSVDGPPSPPRRAHSPSPPRRIRSPNRSRSPRRRDFFTSTRRDPSPAMRRIESPAPRPRLRSRSRSTDRDELERLWCFVTRQPVVVEWNPGFFARQIAFLRALAPEESLEIPVFTPRELELLSYTPDPRELPVLPRECEPIFGPTHRPTERLALESLYRHAGRVNLTVIRLVLLTDAYPRLRAYVRLRAKLVEARDCLALAYGTVLRRRLYPRAGDPNTKDPIAKTTPLVERLRDHLSFRIEMFATSPTSLITRSRFERADIGIGPAHRFEMALRNIVAVEEEALRGRR